MGRLLVALGTAAILLASAASADAAEGEASGPRLIVPANSPIRPKVAAGDELAAAFAGRFTLTGSFRYGCWEECRKPLEPGDLQLEFAPDPQLAAQLPHWQGYTTRPIFEIDNAAAFAAKAIPARTLKEIQSGRRKWITGRIAIVVDDFHTGVDCDAAWYSARFVDLAKPVDLKPVRLAGDYGCS